MWQFCWSYCSPECDWCHLAGWLEAGDSARMMLPSVSLHVSSGPFSLSMWILQVISPTGNQNYWRAVQSTQGHKSQAFFMHKPRTGTRPSLPHKFQTQHSFERGDYTSVVLHQNVIEYQTLLVQTALYPHPTPPLLSFSNMSPLPEMLSLYFSICWYLPHLSGFSSKLLLWLHPGYCLISYCK